MIKRRLNLRLCFFLYKGELLLEQARFEEADETLTLFLSKSKEVENSITVKDAYWKLSDANANLGNFKEAYHFFKKYKTIEKNIETKNTLGKVQRIQKDYELSLKESEIEGLKQIQEISDLKFAQQENQLAFRKLYIILLVFAVLFVLGIGYMLFRRLQFKKDKEKNEIKKQLEIENLKSQQKAELAQVKNNLYANISHEFKTPLTLIRVPLQDFRTKAATKDKARYDSMIKNTDYLLDMLSELLGVSSMESSTVKFQKSNFNLTHLLAQVKLNFAPLFSEKNIQFDWFC